ncbi:MAG TPA: ABC transporter ATP-binding protein [Anaerolineae bacterium]|nr:ABC transporter ATP-binding protein [Anaerolineae bacterium]HUW96055.1 ABC transporter ATP-binding protein [Anaerolineae bacterium]
MLDIRDINTYYGNIHALKGVSLQVEQGEIVTVIGANGAGKTTLLNTISGVLHPATGEVLFDDKSIGKMSPDKVVREGISQVPERRQVFSTLNVLDNLLLGAYIRHRRDPHEEIQKDLDSVFEVFPVLKERQRQMGGTLSGGEQQMLALGRGLMAKPKILLLDEPSLGLAPLLVREIFRVAGELRDRGTTILLVEQNARAALKLADRGYVMETGSVVLEGRSEELLADERVQEAYLGGSTGQHA